MTPIRCRFGFVQVLLFFLVAVATAQEPTAAKPLLERGYLRQTPAGRIGDLYLRTTLVTEEGRHLRHTVQEDTIAYLRSGDPYKERSRFETWEDERGKLVRLQYRTPLGKNQDLVIRGMVKGRTILLEVLNEKTGAPVFSVAKPWNADTLGQHAVETLLAGRKLAAGDRIEYQAFQPTLNASVATTLTVVGPKPLPDGTPAVEVRQTFPKELYFDPTTLLVCPKTGSILKTIEDSTSFGTIEQVAVPVASALAAFEPAVRDKDSIIGIDKPILPFRLGGPRELKLRVRHDTDDDVAGLFVADARLKVVKAEGKTAELLLVAPRTLERYPPEPPPGPEYLGSNFYIRTDAPIIQQLAKTIVGDEKEPRRQMRLIRQWVRKNVKGHYEVPFATADEVARTLEGDCTEMGVLGAALARALGIPSRVAFGLVYDPADPGFGGHLWTEVYLGDHWEAWDPTGVLQTVGAAYLKIGAYSLEGVLNPDELTEIRRGFAGKLRVELLDAQ